MKGLFFRSRSHVLSCRSLSWTCLCVCCTISPLYHISSFFRMDPFRFGPTSIMYFFISRNNPFDIGTLFLPLLPSVVTRSYHQRSHSLNTRIYLLCHYLVLHIASSHSLIQAYLLSKDYYLVPRPYEYNGACHPLRSSEVTTSTRDCLPHESNEA